MNHTIEILPNISLIAAVDKNNNIGLNGDMPWGAEMKSDLNRFKEQTINKTIVMGRKTYDSLPFILPYRDHIVLTRDKSNKHKLVRWVTTIEEVIAQAKTSEKEMMIIGGAEIYRMFLPYASTVYLTVIDHAFEADTAFPLLDSTWELTEGHSYPADDRNPYPYTFKTYKKGHE